MSSKEELRNLFKEKYDINKGISEKLNQEECERLLQVLESEPFAVKLVAAFSEKNSTLRNNNRQLGKQRKNTEDKFASLEAEHQQLEESVKSLEDSKVTLEERKRQLEEEKQTLEQEINTLSVTTRSLKQEVQTLNSKNTELNDANKTLQKENRDLKNIIDAIKLRLARQTRELLQYEDSELRKGIVRLFQWTLG